MRLARVDRGDTFGARAKLALIRLVIGREPFDIIKTLSYRPALLGAPIAPLTQAVMRGSSAWSVGERELMAAFVSRQNQCLF
jgi:hypothetical protein